MKKIFSLISCILILGSCSHSSSENFSIVKKYQHDSNCFTQGLEYHNGYIYESCGLYGKSYIQKYKLGESAEVKQKSEKKYFYEGLTIFKNKIYLLTWKSGVVKILDTNNLELLETKKLPGEIGEGWGITNDGSNLYISNGTKTIFSVNENLEIQKRINTNISNINELEYFNGKIYANIWKTSQISVFGLNSGVLEQTYDASEKSKNYNGEQVLNGITFLENNNMLITGKNWSDMYELKFK